MDKVLRCDCGFEVRADDEAGLVDGVRRHALEAHGMHFSPEEVVQLALRAELDETTSKPQLAERVSEDAS